MNLPSSLTKSFDFHQIDLLKKRSRAARQQDGSTTPDLFTMHQLHSPVLPTDGRTSHPGTPSPPPSPAPDDGAPDPPPPSSSSASSGRFRRFSKKAALILRRHVSFIGPGIIASVAFMDPGNWVTDLAAGAQFGYALNFIILLAGLGGIFLQILAVRMGTVTGNDLARNSRLLCLPEGPDGQVRRDLKWRKSRYALLIVAYLVAEGALIATELAELIGSAIALNLLFPRLPVWGGVLITTVDVLIILLVYKPQGNARVLEYLIGCLVLIVIACYVALLIRVEPDWGLAFRGYLPSKTNFSPSALYASIGIIGAVIMPHSLFLGSHFATIHRLPSIQYRQAEAEEKERQRAAAVAPSDSTWRARFRRALLMIDADLVDAQADATFPRRIDPRKRLSIADMKIQIPHSSWDIALSLFFFAIFVNSAILIVAATAFFYGRGGNVGVGDLYDAFNLLRDILGHVYAILFAVALLAAGQSASITVTLAGQLVSEGFIKWKTNPFVRRLVTRLITIGPSLAVAVAVGRDGLDETLIASQVALSFALPVVLVPLLLVTSMKAMMRVEEDVDVETRESEAAQRSVETESKHETKGDDSQTQAASSSQLIPTNPSAKSSHSAGPASAGQCQNGPGEEEPAAMQEQILPGTVTQTHDFSSPRYIVALGIFIYLVILLADGYTLITTINPNL